MRTPLGRLTCLAIVLVLLLPPAAVATHNSIGAHVNLVTPDEVTVGPEGGELLPDVTRELAPTFHPELPTPRPAPRDQSGTAYRPSDGCQPTTAFQDPATYAQALREGAACYVGYMDGQLEYLQFTQIFAIHRNEDLTYPLNPSPNDDHCTGDGDPITRVQRLGDARCDGSTHDQNVPGYLMVDVDLLEAPIQAGLAGTTGTQEASGTVTFPLLLTPYVFLFGQPHPETVAAGGASAFQAGSGPFGPNPAEGGGPLTDLTGACGDRTQACTLLTPADLMRYDTNAENLAQAGVDLASQARLCHYTPTTAYAHPQPERRSNGPCGPTGHPMDQFLGTTSEGGLGAPGSVATWHNTLPGWYRAVVYSDGGEVGRVLDVADEHVASQPLTELPNPSEDLAWPPTEADADGALDDGFTQIWAVNPRVPVASGPLWCLEPGILAEGSDATAGVPDPGVYGAYQADAVDTDLYRSAMEETYGDVLATEHPLTRPLLAQAEASLEDPAGQTLEELPLPPEVAQALAEAPGRAMPVEDPGHDTPETPRTFTLSQPAGIGCTPEGTLEAREESTELAGGLVFDAVFQANTGNDDQIRSFPQPPGVLLRDPTVLDEGLPAHTEDTEAGAWWTDLHGASGVLQAVVDNDGDGLLEACEAGSGDACLWEGLWDAYNPACRDPQGASCGELLEALGYDLETGVGLVAVLTISGPVLVVDEDRTSGEEAQSRTHVLGTGDPTAQNCVLGASVGLLERVEATDLAEALCPEANGDVAVLPDGFDDQTAVPNNADESTERGLFSLAFQWTRALPAPHALTETTGIGQQDTLCIHAFLPVQEDQVAQDTAGNLALEGNNHLVTCDPLTPGPS